MQVSIETTQEPWAPCNDYLAMTASRMLSKQLVNM